MPYIVDADVFIRAKNDHYGFDFFQHFGIGEFKLIEKDKFSV